MKSRSQRVGTAGHLEAVGRAVDVAVDSERIGAGDVRLEAVGETVAVGVPPGRVGADEPFEDVGEPVAVRVTGQGLLDTEGSRRRPERGPVAQPLPGIDLVVRRRGGG